MMVPTPVVVATAGGIGAMRSAGGTFPQFGEDGQLLAVDHGEIDSSRPSCETPLMRPAFLRGSDVAKNSVAAARHDPAVGDNGSVERGSESVAGVIVIARERLGETREMTVPAGMVKFEERERS
jgi:hypothetical protein